MKYNQLFITNFEAEPHLALLTILLQLEAITFQTETKTCLHVRRVPSSDAIPSLQNYYQGRYVNNKPKIVDRARSKSHCC